MKFGIEFPGHEPYSNSDDHSKKLLDEAANYCRFDWQEILHMILLSNAKSSCAFLS